MSKDVVFVGTLRPVQVDATKDVLRCIRKHGGAVLVKDCGMGKTVDASYIGVELGCRTGIIVHNEDLAEQWKERIKQWFPAAKVSVVQQDKMVYEGMDFVIFMVQSITSRTSEKARAKGNAYPKELFASIGFLVVDECHHIGAPTFCRAISNFCPKYSLAMTATPKRKDLQAHLISWFMGPLAHLKERDPGQMKVTVHVHKHTTGNMKEIRYRNGMVGKAKMVDRMFDDPVRNKSILDRLTLRIKEGRKILVLSTYHYGLNMINDLLKLEMPDVDARFYTGKVKKALRAEALRGQIIFATTPKGDEALDVPELDTLFRIDPVSESKQPVGRILRDCPGKMPLVVEQWHDPFSIFDGMFHNCLRYYHACKFTIVNHFISPPDEVLEEGSDEEFTFF